MFKQKKALSFLAILLLSIDVGAKINISVSEEKQVLCQEIYKKMVNEHFFNDKDLTSINSEILDALVDQLDSEKIYFKPIGAEELILAKKTYCLILPTIQV